MFADYIGSAEALYEILRHEVYAHFAIDSLSPKDRAELHGELLRAIKSDPTTRAFYEEHVAPAYGSDETAETAEEVVARVAENPKRPTWIQRLMAEVRRILRKFKFTEKYGRMTLADIESLVWGYMQDITSGKWELNTTREGANEQNLMPFLRRPVAVAVEAVRKQMQPGLARRIEKGLKTLYNDATKLAPILFTADRSLRALGEHGVRLAEMFYQQSSSKVSSAVSYFQGVSNAHKRWLGQWHVLTQEMGEARITAALKETSRADIQKEPRK